MFDPENRGSYPIGVCSREGVWTLRENTPVEGSFYQIPVPENPVKRLVSVRMENMLKSSPVCQNTAGKHLSQWLPKGIKSGLFSSPSLVHPMLKRLPECECGGLFSRRGF
jgi:rRNA maturation protein Nop10